MSSLITNSLATAKEELNHLRRLSSDSSFAPQYLIPAARPAIEPVVVTLVQQVDAPEPNRALAAGGAADTVSVSASSQPSNRVPAGSPSVHANVQYGVDVPDEPLTESAAAEIKRLENTVRDLSEINDRIMAQNIALLADLEASQRAVRDLRGEKDSLAVQLRSSLQRLEAAGQ